MFPGKVRWEICFSQADHFHLSVIEITFDLHATLNVNPGGERGGTGSIGSRK